MTRFAELFGIPLLLAAMAGGASTSSRPASSRFVPHSSSRVELRGTATIGEWSCSSTKILGQVILPTDLASLDSTLEELERLGNESPSAGRLPGTALFEEPPVAELSVPINTLTADSRGMERDLRNALREREYPLIVFRYSAADAVKVGRNSRTGELEIQMRIRGDLVMAGVRRPLGMDVTIIRETPRRFRLHAGTPVLMSDFKVTPPSAFFGLIRAHNRVVVTFDVEMVACDP